MLNNLKKITLKDGRQLAFSQFGDLTGKPLFYFHGWPGSRLGASVMDNTAKKLKIRIIAPDRPGMGQSDFLPNRTFLDWPDDVLELADFLHFKRFAVIGSSGGTPYALACAYKIPTKLTKVGNVGTLAPIQEVIKMNKPTVWEKVKIWFYYNLQRYIIIYLLLLKLGAKYFPTFIYNSLPGKPNYLKKILKQNSKGNILRESILESLRFGTKGAALEYKLNLNNWGFKLRNIRKKIYLWHGLQDKYAPPVFAVYIVKTVKSHQAVFYPNDGHYLLLKYGESILKELIK